MTPIPTTYRGAEYSPKLRPADHIRPSIRMRRRLRNVRRRVYGLGARCGYWLLPRAPRWVTRLVARGLITPIARLMLRQRVEKNLAKVYGNELSERDRRHILRQVFRGTGSLLEEFTGSIAKGPAFYEDRIDDSEARARVAAIEANSRRGWIGITAHLGNWILLASWVSRLPGGRACRAIAKRQPNPHLNRVIESAYQHIDLTPIYGNDRPTDVVFEILRHLKRGSRLGIVADQDSPRVPGMFVDFLGHSAYTATGPASIALTTGVPLVPLAFVRKGDGFAIISREPIYPDRERPRDEEIARLTMAWGEAIQDMIREYPEQWSWFHQRWATTPEKLVAQGRQKQPHDPNEQDTAPAVES